jgi:hypothetical protein
MWISTQQTNNWSDFMHSSDTEENLNTNKQTKTNSMTLHTDRVAAACRQS